MRTNHRKIWPPFLVVALVVLLGLFVLDGPAAGAVLFVAMLGFIGACIHALAGERVQDGVGGIGGPFGHM